jgi:hypothetical protein
MIAGPRGRIGGRRIGSPGPGPAARGYREGHRTERVRPIFRDADADPFFRPRPDPRGPARSDRLQPAPVRPGPDPAVARRASPRTRASPTVADAGGTPSPSPTPAPTPPRSSASRVLFTRKLDKKRIGRLAGWRRPGTGRRQRRLLHPTESEWYHAGIGQQLPSHGQGGSSRGLPGGAVPPAPCPSIHPARKATGVGSAPARSHRLPGPTPVPVNADRTLRIRPAKKPGAPESGLWQPFSDKAAGSRGGPRWDATDQTVRPLRRINAHPRNFDRLFGGDGCGADIHACKSQ